MKKKNYGDSVSNSWKETSQRRGKDSVQKSSSSKLFDIVISIVLFTTAVCLNYRHTTSMFQNEKRFSHLSNTEREISFQTEMGLYYSYYKTLIEAPTYVSGILQITNDNVTEYPSVINTLQRFNLYPEVMTAFLYRNFRTVTDFFGIRTFQCRNITRGRGLPDVQSCIGIGDPMYFYVRVVYIMHAIMMGVFYLFGSWLSDSHLGGIVAVSAHFFNNSHCTRVQWSPPLRESFAHPIMILQIWITSIMLRKTQSSKYLMLLNSFASLVSILFWQFTPFALTTQIIAVTAIYVIDLLNEDIFNSFLKGQFLALVSSVVLLFGNRMLVCSLMTSSLIAARIVVKMAPLLKQRIKVYIIRWVVAMTSFLVLTIFIKLILAKVMKVDDDAHIVDILKSKFTDFNTFHTQLYTCAVTFGFMESAVYLNLTKTLLLPSAVLVVLIVVLKLRRYVFTMDGKVDAAILYNVLQLCALTVMAVLIMRLKILWTPQLCLVSALLASRKIVPLSTMNRSAIIGILLATMSFQGWKNLNEQWSIKGEFYDPQTEQLMEWINQTTTLKDVFAGPMPIMATVKLVTKRPIVIHPHYEDSGLRARTKKVYTIYSRKPVKQVWQTLVDLQVNYLIMDMNYCRGKSSSGCLMSDVWDRVDMENRGRKIACAEIEKNPGPYFSLVRTTGRFYLMKVNVVIRGE